MELGSRVNTYGRFLKERYGKRTFRAGIALGKECQHRVRTGGCIFCQPGTFIDSEVIHFEDPAESSWKQLQNLVPKIRKGVRQKEDLAFLAYYQDGLPYDYDTEQLRKTFLRIGDFPGVRGIIVSSRFDCITKEFISMLTGLPVDVYLELGLQSCHQKSLDFLNRNEKLSTIKSVLELCREAGLHTGVHLIIGIPGEDEKDIMETVDFVNSCRVIKEVKLHNLTVYKETPLARFPVDILDEIPSLDRYIYLLGRIVSRLRKDIVVSRFFTSNVRGNNQAVNPFSGVKRDWLARLSQSFDEGQIRQGMNCSA